MFDSAQSLICSRIYTNDQNIVLHSLHIVVQYNTIAQVIVDSKFALVLVMTLVKSFLSYFPSYWAKCLRNRIQRLLFRGQLLRLSTLTGWWGVVGGFRTTAAQPLIVQPPPAPDSHVSIDIEISPPFTKSTLSKCVPAVCWFFLFYLFIFIYFHGYSLKTGRKERVVIYSYCLSAPLKRPSFFIFWRVGLFNLSANPFRSHTRKRGDGLRWNCRGLCG